MAVESAARSRRAVLMGVAGAVAGSIAAALGQPAPARAGVDGDVVLGATNEATTMTRINVSANTNPAFMAANTTENAVGLRGEGDGYGAIGVGAFVGVQGESNESIGVRGVNGSGGIGTEGRGPETGVRGVSFHGTPTSDFNVPSHHTGVIGLAGGFEGELPDNTDETGVYGLCDLSPISTGVWGDSLQGFGVFGSGDVGIGGNGFLAVYGVPSGAGASGVFARAGTGQTAIYGFAGTVAAPAPIPNVAIQARAGSSSQVALSVTGRAQFSRSGRTSIATAKASKVITMSGITTASYIIATLQTNRTGIYVRAVVPAAGKFTIYLNKAVPGTTYVGYLVIN